MFGFFFNKNGDSPCVAAVQYLAFIFAYRRADHTPATEIDFTKHHRVKGIYPIVINRTRVMAVGNLAVYHLANDTSYHHLSVVGAGITDDFSAIGATID